MRLTNAWLLIAVLCVPVGCTTSPYRLNVVATTGQGDPIDKPPKCKK